MGITTESITSMLEKVVELLELDDDAEVKVTLSLNIIKLIIDYIGAENIAEGIGEGFEEIYNLANEYINGLTSDLSTEERAAKLAETRTALDALFEKMNAISSEAAA